MTTQDILDIMEGRVDSSTYPHYVNPHKLLSVYIAIADVTQAKDFSDEKLERLYDFATGLFEQ